MKAPARNKQTLRKLETSLENFDELKARFEDAVKREQELHAIVDPALDKIAASIDKESGEVLIAEDVVLPLGNPPLIFKKGASRADIRFVLDALKAEIIRAKEEMDALFSELESRAKHIQNLSRKGGLAK
ncbi:hypothetical protein [Horticoccus sp. 23ND18S-11]|uniref:hypothetical protein n=1 Tax=Horticoccus sp. 23ND18S-11 TaxID=3391832 RepID=UPI0039C98248